MPTLEDVRNQIKQLGWADTFGTKKEIKSLPEILAANEPVLGLTSGIMNGNTWLITLTDRRIIFLDKGFLYGLRQLEVPLEKINTIEQKTGLFFGQVGIADGSSTMAIGNILKASVKPFVLALNQALESRRHRASSNPTTSGIAAQISQLAALKEKGVLNQTEFEAAKTKVLKAA